MKMKWKLWEILANIGKAYVETKFVPRRVPSSYQMPTKLLEGNIIQKVFHTANNTRGSLAPGTTESLLWQMVLLWQMDLYLRMILCWFRWFYVVQMVLFVYPQTDMLLVSQLIDAT